MGRIGIVEVAIVVLIVIILFGEKTKPEKAKSITRAMKEFRKASRDDENGK